jgi:glycine betaine/proline transport system permease protein
VSVVALGATTPVVGAARPRWIVPAIGAGALVAMQVVLAALDRFVEGFPDRLYLHIADPIDDLQGWIQDNRLSHPLFTWFLEPFRGRVNDTLDSLTDLFLWLPWFTLPLVVFVLVARTGRWRSALFATSCMAFPGVVGLWEPAMETMSLMIVSVALAVVIGVPLGIWTALSERANRFMRPVLDAMQTVPSTAYLVPAVLLFSIGQVPATVATVIYALPPVVRLTALGIRQVPHDTVEAGRMFGSSRRQLLTKVQLPQAIPSIVTGINQTINMALGIVVIASLVGAGGLGEAVLESLRLRAPGRGLVIGAAIVSLALVFDRVTRSFIERPTPLPNAPSRRGRALVVAAAIVVAVSVARVADWIEFPVSWGTDFADPIDDAITWIRDHVRWLTKDVNDFIVRELWVRNTGFLKNTIAWPVLVLGTAALGWWVKGWTLALFCGAAIFGIGLVGLWDPAIDTLVQVLIAVVIAAAIALPLGVWLGRHPRVETALSPFLDAMQTIPSLVYAIPFVMIFAVGIVPGGIIASVLYAIPPGVRVSALGVRQVPESTIEAATTFGASSRQVLWGVRIPLALPAIMLAVNQVILMVVAMVIIAGLTGGGGLGYLIIDTFTRTKIGQGVEVAIALTLMAMVLDRLTQGLAERFQPPAAAH